MDAFHRPQKLWIVAERDAASEQVLQNELGISDVLASVLVARGLNDPVAAHAFLNPSLDDLHDPSLLPDFIPARDAILAARERKEKIFVHGDYDVDGVTSAALFTRFLRSLGCDVAVHVPHRMKEGYGIHLKAVEAAKELGAKLFLTCDCGSSAIEQVEAARAAGLTVVVTDHHSIGDEVPDAAAFVNPHRNDSQYPFMELSGVGVAFKLCEGLTVALGHEKRHFYRAFLDLAALGTIADVMPLTGENRVIARHGLEQLGKTKKVGLQALMVQANVDPSKPLRGYDVGYLLGPRLNAAGRVDDARIALELLLDTDANEARARAEAIEVSNSARRAEQQRILHEAIEEVKQQGVSERNVIVLAKEGWHSGVIGIVAGRLVEMFRRPVFVMSIDSDGSCHGSGRSIPAFDLAGAIRAHPGLMSGGGHAMAAGCRFPLGRLGEVSDTLHAYAGGLLSPEDFLPTVAVDAVVQPGSFTRADVEALSALEPYGCMNPEPVFVAEGVTLVESSPTRKPEHVRALLRGDDVSIPAIGFNMGGQLDKELPGCRLDVAFRPELNEFRGKVTLQWKIQDYRRTCSSELPLESADSAETALV